MAIEIDLNDFSNGVAVNGEWTGTGVFDEIMHAINGNIKIQFDEGRIKGSDYANVYLNGMQAAISESIATLTSYTKKDFLSKYF